MVPGLPAPVSEPGQYYDEAIAFRQPAQPTRAQAARRTETVADGVAKLRTARIRSIAGRE
jgi:hypothetical protein